MVPVMASSAGVAGDRLATPLSTFTSTPAGLAMDRVPFGPLTLRVSP